MTVINRNTHFRLAMLLSFEAGRITSNHSMIYGYPHIRGFDQSVNKSKVLHVPDSQEEDKGQALQIQWSLFPTNTGNEKLSQAC